MNTRPPLENPNRPVVLSITFNKDNSCFAIGLNSGFSVFDSAICAPKVVREFNAGIGLAQMMGKTNFLALVGGGRQPKFSVNKMMLWDDNLNKVALEISFLTAVRGVQLDRQRIVVVLQNSVRVYSFSKSPDLQARYETADNLLGLCAMSDRMIAFPGRTSGQVQLVESATGNVSIIPAHSASLVAIRFSPDGELLATASDKGTIIRVFATSNCARIAELRRGWDQATIFSLAFSPSGTMLACTSDKGTLHIYDVPHPNKPLLSSSSTAASSSPASASRASASTPGVVPASPRSPRLGSGPYYPPSPGSAISSTPGGGPPGAATITPSSMTSFPSPASAAGTSSSGGPGGGGPESDNNSKGKWGILGKIPLMPRYFSDVVSFAQVNFSAGEDFSLSSGGGGASSSSRGGGGGGVGGGIGGEAGRAAAHLADGATYGTAPRPPKGVIGWQDEGTLLVVGAGYDARWERFVIGKGQDGKRYCARTGWRRVLAGS